MEDNRVPQRFPLTAEAYTSDLAALFRDITTGLIEKQSVSIELNKKSFDYFEVSFKHKCFSQAFSFNVREINYLRDNGKLRAYMEWVIKQAFCSILKHRIDTLDS